jgi:hypothetical protein
MRRIWHIEPWGEAMSNVPDRTATPVPAQQQHHPPAVPVQHTPVIPTAPALDKRTYASPMSYVGSGRRTTAWIRKTGRSGPAAAVFAWGAGITYLSLMWLVVLPVYLFVTFGIFGVFMIPFRIIRRGSRKQQHLQEVQLATMQQMMVAQQQQMIQNQRQI